MAAVDVKLRLRVLRARENLRSLKKKKPKQPEPKQAEPEPEHVTSFTRAEIIKDIEKTLSFKGTQRIEGRERLAFLDKLAQLKGYNAVQDDDRPPDPCHIAGYIMQWAGRMGAEYAAAVPDGELILFGRMIEAAGWAGADLSRLWLRYQAKSQQTPPETDTPDA